MNNFNKIKSMSVDEMAEFIYRLKDCEDVDCDKCMRNSLCAIGIHDKDDVKQWLLAEVEE